MRLPTARFHVLTTAGSRHTTSVDVPYAVGVIDGPYFVISGLPGSGKTTLGRRLAAVAELEMVDKDDFLEASFDAYAQVDEPLRDRLSRKADLALRKRAEHLGRGVLVSWWRHPSGPQDSGTPIDWLFDLPRVVELACRCSPATAAERFHGRRRHAGHGDRPQSPTELQSQFEQLDGLGPLGVGPLVDVDTETEPDIIDVMRRIVDLGRTRP